MMHHLFFLFLLVGVSLTGALPLGVMGSQPVAAQPSPLPPSSASPQTTDGEQDDSWERISGQGSLRVGLDPSLGRAYLYIDPETRAYQGFEWDILEAIAQQLQVDLEPIYVPWSQHFEALRQQEVDLVLGAREAMGIPADLLATRPYYLSPQRLVVPAIQAEAPEHLSQLFGQKVGVVINSTGAALLETYNRSRGNGIRLFATSDPQRLFDQLRSGQLDAIVIDQPVAIMEAGPTLRITGPALVPMPLVGVVLNEHLSLKQALDQALSDLQRNGSLKRILEEWQLWDSATLPKLSED